MALPAPPPTITRVALRGRSLTRRSPEAQAAPIRLLDRNANACPAYGYGRKWGRGSLSKTWDPDWSNGKSKQQIQMRTTEDGLIVPYRSALPWSERINAENELDWLTSTQNQEIATTLATFRNSGVAGYTLDHPDFRDRQESGPNIQITTATGFRVLTASGTPLELPPAVTLRQIETERAAVQSSKYVLKVSLKRSRNTGEPFAMYWIGWLREPVFNKDGTLKRAGKPRRLPETDKTREFLAECLARFLAMGLTPEGCEAERKERIARAKAYGRLWQYTLMTPDELAAGMDPRTMPAEAAPTQDVPSQDEEDALRMRHLLSAHDECPRREVDGMTIVLHKGCAAYGEAPPPTPDNPRPRWEFYEPDRTWFANQQGRFTSPTVDEFWMGDT